MKSAEAYPEYQGDGKNNMQALNRIEHKDVNAGEKVYKNEREAADFSGIINDFNCSNAINPLKKPYSISQIICFGNHDT